MNEKVKFDGFYHFMRWRDKDREREKKIYLFICQQINKSLIDLSFAYLRFIDKIHF